MSVEVEMKRCPGSGRFMRERDDDLPIPEHGTCDCCGAMLPFDEERLFYAPEHEVPASTFTCFVCGDKGTVPYKTLGDLEPRPIGNGYTIQDMGSSGTRACSCVRDLPPIDEPASWWESETVLYEVFASAFASTVIGDPVEITVESEIPRAKNGRRCVMRGNRYYPTMIRVEGEAGQLHGQDARDFAAVLQRAADKVDEIDRPCDDLCGHWWPCDCVADAVGKALAPFLGIPSYTREERWKMDHPF